MLEFLRITSDIFVLGGVTIAMWVIYTNYYKK